MVRFVKTPSNPPQWGDSDLRLIHGHCCPGQGVCQKSSRSLKPFGHNTPTLQTDRRTDRRISYGIGLDLTVGQKPSSSWRKRHCYNYNDWVRVNMWVLHTAFLAVLSCSDESLRSRSSMSSTFPSAHAFNNWHIQHSPQSVRRFSVNKWLWWWWWWWWWSLQKQQQQQQQQRVFLFFLFHHKCILQMR